MGRSEFLELIDDLLEYDLGTLTGEEILVDLDSWDSLAVMGFIALVDEKFEITLSPKRIAASNKVNDLIELLDNKVT
jgi:acyl carrier protein